MKIVIAATPQPGHLNPLLAVARMAKERGDEIVVTTAQALGPAVEAAGMRFIPLEPGADLDLRKIDSLFPERDAEPPGPARLAFDFKRVFIDTMPAQAKTLRNIIAKEAPDIIIADNLFCGTTPIFLDDHRQRPPIMVCGITFLWLDRPDGAPAGMGLPPAQNAVERERYAKIAAEFDEVFSRPVQSYADAKLAALGLPGLTASFTASRVLLADSYIQPSVPEFEYDFGMPPASLRYVGALPPPPNVSPTPDWWDDLDGSRRIVVVTQGTIANYDFGQLLEPTLEALADRDDLLVLATTGGRPVESLHRRIPDNARVARFLPFDTLLPKANLLITNGGYGTVSLALQAGIPIVSAGLTEDKAEVSARVAWAGVGINLASNSPSAATLRKGVEEVLANQSYGERARFLSAKLAQYDARTEVLSAIDQLVSSRSHSNALFQEGKRRGSGV
jgi:UDP:flavonoid glycosyltransferase YjiC (YdhE family)